MMHKLLTGALTVEHLRVSIADLPAHLKGLRLVQLSDFHFDGIRLSPRLLDEAISASNQAQPDLVVMTGDFVTDDPAPIHNLAQRLTALKSQSGVYAVLGNHDIRYRHSRQEVASALESQNIQVLWNQIAYPVGKELAIVGLADFWSSDFRPAPVLEQLDSETPRIVLSHNPDTAEILQKWRIDLQLSGHTHGGQVFVPGVGNMAHHISQFYRNLPPKAKRYVPLLKECAHTMKHWEWAQGLHSVGQNQLYVNRGLGTYWPGRFWCPPEVTVITLV
ncbi:metallophosphoesterase [Leptolyngbya sp. Cla-17]|uniref:metallophosphoesterase n=1 Tax=Leptolyngbya sp. Cla-17 TaxID=2803751 RepID=UPI0018D7F223|nr:metallophosphoesterase [Leptolyngbya sp. Cla-17]